MRTVTLELLDNLQLVECTLDDNFEYAIYLGRDLFNNTETLNTCYVVKRIGSSYKVEYILFNNKPALTPDFFTIHNGMKNWVPFKVGNTDPITIEDIKQLKF